MGWDSDYDDYEPKRECSDCECKYNLFEKAFKNIENVIQILYKNSTIDAELLNDYLEETYDAICEGCYITPEFPTSIPHIARSKNTVTALSEIVKELNLARAI